MPLSIFSPPLRFALLLSLVFCVALGGHRLQSDDSTSSSETLLASGNDWPVFRGDSQGRGVSMTKLPDAPLLLWSYNVPDGAFLSAVSIVDSVVLCRRRRRNGLRLESRGWHETVVEEDQRRLQRGAGRRRRTDFYRRYRRHILLPRRDERKDSLAARATEMEINSSANFLQR